MTSTPGSTPVPPTTGRRYVEQQGDPNRTGFGGTIGWTLAGTLIPGLGLWRAGHRIAGGIIIGLVVLSFGSLAAFAVINPTALKAAAVNPDLLTAIALGLLGIALGWVAVITFTHLALRPKPASMLQRISGGILVGFLALTVTAPLAVGANVAYTTGVGLTEVFSGDTQVDVADPWDGAKRLNILILGGDSGTGRDAALGIRPDSVSVASIDIATGATTLINIPRQTAKMPFPKDSPLHKYYPNGFYDGVSGLNQEYALNAMYRNIPARVPKDILGKTKSLGAEIMKISVGEALGLDINYYVMVNMDGFKDIINAIGGITVNVNDRVPIGGHNASGSKPEEKPRGWIEIGPNQKLSGTKALWFARGRYHTTDYKRMERQQCVINAVVKQSDPATVLSNYQSIVAAGAKTIRTDVPRSLLPAIADLALLAKSHSIRNILLNHQIGFDTTNPNWPAVRARVKKGLAEAVAGATATNTAAPAATTAASTPATSSASSSPTASATKKKKTKSGNLDDACAYHPNNK